jgi:hypothetical protein
MAARSLIRGPRSALTRTDNLRVACEACVFGHVEHTCTPDIVKIASQDADRVQSELRRNLADYEGAECKGSAIEVQDDLLARAGKL